MDGTAELVGFAYGEDIEQGSGRSLGYRLLAPATGPAWAAEAEALARRLQAAPYPDAWPAVDLFCSVLLADGRRLIARARYGLTDHTASGRRGGLELLGVVAPAGLDARSALAVYRWLGQRREAEEDLHRLGGTHRLAEVLSAAPPEPVAPEKLSGPVPVLPVRLWQEGTFLFAASAPADPDHHLRLLEIASTAHWQWLPLVGPDFPLPTYAQRGPLIAWTAHLAGVAVRLDRPAPPPPPPPPRRGWLTAVLTGLLLALLGGNLWALLTLHQDIAALPREPQGKEEPPPRKLTPPPPREADDGRERFARALFRLMTDQSGDRAGKDERAALLDRYEVLARRYPELAVDTEEGKLAVAAASVLAGRSPARIDQAVKQALEGKGFSDKLIEAARDHVREQFAGGK